PLSISKVVNQGRFAQKSIINPVMVNRSRAAIPPERENLFRSSPRYEPRIPRFPGGIDGLHHVHILPAAEFRHRSRRSPPENQQRRIPFLRTQRRPILYALLPELT